jgi:hypothetical protein
LDSAKECYQDNAGLPSCFEWHTRERSNQTVPPFQDVASLINHYVPLLLFCWFFFSMTIDLDTNAISLKTPSTLSCMIDASCLLVDGPQL